MRKHNHAVLKNEEKDCNISDEVMKEFTETIAKDALEKMKQRRIIIREATGEIMSEIPLFVGVCLFIALLVFLFPVVIIALIVGYAKKLQVEVIIDVTDDEAEMLDTLEHQQTMVGINYEHGDGQATVIQ